MQTLKIDVGLAVYKKIEANRERLDEAHNDILMRLLDIKPAKKVDERSGYYLRSEGKTIAIPIDTQLRFELSGTTYLGTTTNKGFKRIDSKGREMEDSYKSFSGMVSDAAKTIYNGWKYVEFQDKRGKWRSVQLLREEKVKRKNGLYDYFKIGMPY